MRPLGMVAVADAEQEEGPFHLEDLEVGRRFTSRPHLLDAAQIKTFAREFDRFGVPWMVNVIPSADWRPAQG